MEFDPASVGLYADSLLAGAAGLVTTAQTMALLLLGSLLVLEVALVGIMTALGQGAVTTRMVSRLLLAGVLLLLISEAPALLQILTATAERLSGGSLADLLPDPVALAVAGLRPTLDLLRFSADTGPQMLGASVALAGLALAILVVFAAASACLLYQLVAFYVSAAMALFIMPLGILTGTRRVMGRALAGLAGAMVRMTAVLVIHLPLPALLAGFEAPLDRGLPLDVPLAQFCLGMILLVLLLRLPDAAQRVVGDFLPLAAVQATPAPAAPAAAAVAAAGSAPPLPALSTTRLSAHTPPAAGTGSLTAQAPAVLLPPPGSAVGAPASAPLHSRSITAAPGSMTLTATGSSSAALPSAQTTPRSALSQHLEAARSTAADPLAGVLRDALRQALQQSAPVQTRTYRAVAAATRTEDEDETPGTPS